jgi:predicted porin
MAVVGGYPGHNGPAIGNGDTTGSNPNLNCANTIGGGATLTANSTVICGQVEAGATQFHRRAANVVQYWSPKFGGFDVRVAMTMNEEKGRTPAAISGVSNDPRLWSINGTYAAGPWYATVAYEQHRGYRDTTTATAPVNVKDKGWILGGGYNFGVAAVNLAYERLKYGNAGVAGSESGFTRPSWFIGGSFPLGPAGSALRAGYSRMSGLKSCGTAVVCGSTTGLRVFTLGYEYALSKRSAMYVEYGKLSNSSASAVAFNTSPTGPTGSTAGLTAGQDQTSLGVGLKHTF